MRFPWSGLGVRAADAALRAAEVLGTEIGVEPIGRGADSVVFKGKLKSALLGREKEEFAFKVTSSVEAAEREVGALQVTRGLHTIEFIARAMVGRRVVVAMGDGGETLSELLYMRRCQKPEAGAASFFDVPWLVDVGGQLFEGLAYVHQNGFVHRDIKPSNLLLVGGIVKIGDFGFAKRMDQAGLVTGVDGTPKYVAPEVVCERPHGAPADIWSAGLSLFKMMTLKDVPFDGIDMDMRDCTLVEEQATRVVVAVTQDLNARVEMAGPSNERRALAELRDLIIEMVNINPAERPTAAELVGRWQRVTVDPLSSA